MLFYAIILLTLLILSSFRSNKSSEIIIHFFLFALIALKGEVGPDYHGYLYRYMNFDVSSAFKKAAGEYSWYLIEYFVNINNWDYQFYTFLTALIAVFFLYKAQKKIKYLGFLVFIYQIIIIQLGLSGMRQFIATCIIIYTFSSYIFENRKSGFKFFLLTILASSFHISALTTFIFLPFLINLKRNHFVIIILLASLGLFSEILTPNVEEVDARYFNGIKVSAGAWVRFFLTLSIIRLGMVKDNIKLLRLGYLIGFLGVLIGLFNTVLLHRFNYYFLPISCLILIYNYHQQKINIYKMRLVYIFCIFYFFVWFLLSDYAVSYIPYETFL